MPSLFHVVYIFYTCLNRVDSQKGESVKIYVLVWKRDEVGEDWIRSIAYFSTKQKALDYLDTIISNDYISEDCTIEVKNGLVTIEWWYEDYCDTMDDFYLEEIELDPSEYPIINNEDKVFVTFWD